MSALGIIPAFMRSPEEFNVTLQTLQSIRDTQPDIDVLVVDDFSPAQGFVDELETHADRLGFEVHRKPENTGFSKTVNVGLQRALDARQDAVLINADVEFVTADWLGVMTRQLDSLGRPASVVGPLLLYPNGLIQQASIFFSLLTRTFDHLYRFGPGELPEAQVSRIAPVTGAVQFIRHECLASVGIYDPEFSMAYEDVDYCLRVFESGRECVYQPSMRVVHHESLFRGRADAKINEWQNASWQLLMKKHATTNMAAYVPPLV